jgi:hypothetical protein
MKYLILIFVLLLTGCGEVPFVAGAYRTSVSCIGGYKFAVVQAGSGSIAVAQSMPPEQCSKE